MLVQAAATAGFTPAIELEAGDLLGKVALVAAGLGVALIPSMLVPALRPDVAVRRLTDPPMRSVYAVTRRHQHSATPGVEILIDALRQAAI